MEAAGDRQGDRNSHGGTVGKVVGLRVVSMETHHTKIKGKMKGYKGWRVGGNP